MMSGKIILSLGSNMGDRKKNIHQALAGLKERGFLLEKVSSFYETEPVDYRNQDDFLNIVISGSYDGEQRELLEVIKTVEDFLGRVKKIPQGPRVIDIDIILFGDNKIESDDLEIPHPEFANRRFVLVPSVEIEPDVIDPRSGRKLREILLYCKDRSGVKLAGKVNEV